MSMGDRASRLFTRKIDLVRHSDNTHIGFDGRSAGDDCLFLIAILKPDLTIQTVAVPAKLTV